MLAAVMSGFRWCMTQILLQVLFHWKHNLDTFDSIVIQSDLNLHFFFLAVHAEMKMYIQKESSGRCYFSQFHFI